MKLPRLDGLRVLFADDRRDARFVVQQILKTAGAEVTLSENGHQALEAVTAFRPGDPTGFDVVVLDISMPVMDGLAVTRVIRQKGYQLPILALTAGVMDLDRQECFEAGCDEYCPKPINAAHLIGLISGLAAN